MIEVYSHRRRIKIEEKAYRSSLRGKEFIKFFAALAVLPGTILNNRMHSTRMIERKVWIHHIIENRPRQNSECGKELHKFFPPTEKTTFVFTSVLCILLLWLHIYTHYTIFTILVNFITGPFKRITVEACLQEEEDWTCTPSTWPASLSSSSSSLSPASASPSPTGTGGASAHSTWQKSGAIFRGKKIGHSTRCSNLFKDPHSKILLFTVIF